LKKLTLLTIGGDSIR